MTYSLNEIEAMAKRAARGAGYHWGHAEEAGKAARWLAEQDLPGPELLAALLATGNDRNKDEAAPHLLSGPWRAVDGDLCPLLAGSALSDLASELADGRVFELETVAYPALLAPYAAFAAQATGCSVNLSWDETGLLVSSDGVVVEGSRDGIEAPRTGHVTCRKSTTRDLTPAPGRNGRAVDAKTWTVLGELAQRTFAPATEASRLAGAGAGLTDND